jgi:large repetitive protein
MEPPMSNSKTAQIHRQIIRPVLRSAVAFGISTMLAVTGLVAVSNSADAALKVPFVSAACNVTVSAGTGTIVSGLIIGVTPGTTKITFDCNDATSAAIVAEASLLSAIGTTSVSQSSEADTTGFGAFTASSTDTGCPAATAGSCTVATFAVPSTFTASDAKATCPPSQTQINEGLFGCAVAVATAVGTPVSGAEYLMTFASQTTPPNPPSIEVSPSTGVAGSSVKVSDATANTGFWWANAVQATQASALGTTATPAPSTCAASGGYGAVPAAFLEVNWFATGSTTAIPGSAAGVSISNDCYDGTTLHAPVLSGTIPVPSTLKIGSTYSGYLCELNVTPYPSNDTNAANDCGPAPGGESWIDASFSFTDALGPITQSAPLSGSTPLGAAYSVQLNVSGSSGTVSFVTSSPTVAGLTVSSSGLLSSSASLAAGSYVISGTDSDTSGDSGTWTYALGVGTAQAALTITSVAGTVGKTLALTTSGGSSTGAVTFTATNGTAAGCTVSGSALSATSAGTCLVVATKAGDSTYLPVSSGPTDVSMTTGSGALKLVSRDVVLTGSAKKLPIRVSCGAAACVGTLSVVARLQEKRAGSTIELVVKLPVTGYRLNPRSSKTVNIELNSVTRRYLTGNPDRPRDYGVLEVTDNLGKKHTNLGRVSLLK